MFNQPALEALLDAPCPALLGVDVRRGVEVTGVDQRDDHVVVGGADGTVAVGPLRRRLRRRQQHRARRWLDLPVTDLGFFYDWLIVDVVLDEPRVFDPINLQICDPARPTTAVSGGPGRRRWEFMRLPDESLDELDDEQRAWELLAPWDVHPGNARLERHAVYTFNARYAERWRAGRVLLAGDAAHLMPPFAGQGMCSGIRDAANLAWKLDLVLDGRAADALLDTYAAERLPSARAAIDFSMELGKVICVPDPAEAAARDEAMAAGVDRRRGAVRPACPASTGGFIQPTAPHAGTQLVQGKVGGRPFDDVHGAGWRLVVTRRRRPADRRRRARRGSRRSAARSSPLDDAPTPTVRPLVRRARRPRGRCSARLPPLRHRADGSRRDARCSPTSATHLAPKGTTT